MLQDCFEEFKRRMTPQQKAAAAEWTELKETVHLAQSSEHEHKILNQFAALLSWMVDDANIGTTGRMEFAFRFRLAVSGMKGWERIEKLIHSTLDKYPVGQVCLPKPLRHDLTHCPTGHPIQRHLVTVSPLSLRSYAQPNLSCCMSCRWIPCEGQGHTVLGSTQRTIRH